MAAASSSDPSSRKRRSLDGLPRPLRIAMNVITGVLLVAAGYLAAGIVPIHRAGTAAQDTTASGIPKVLQINVLNGCGARGAGAQCTEVLRAGGFDVVEMKNYTSFNVQNTLVVDRVGNMKAARRVAAALGVSGEHIIQQINPDYYVDVSVIVGADFKKNTASR